MISLIPVLIVISVVAIWTALKRYFEKNKINKLGDDWKKRVSILRDIV